METCHISIQERFAENLQKYWKTIEGMQLCMQQSKRLEKVEEEYGIQIY